MRKSQKLMKNKREYSAYNINCFGALCYAGLPVESENIKYEHHNCCSTDREECSFFVPKYHIEVTGASLHGLNHGGPKSRKFKIF